MDKINNNTAKSSSELVFQNSELNQAGIITPPRTLDDQNKKHKTLDFQKWRGKNDKLKNNREKRTREQFTLQFLSKDALQIESLVDEDGIFNSQTLNDSVNYSYSKNLPLQLKSSKISYQGVLESEIPDLENYDDTQYPHDRLLIHQSLGISQHKGIPKSLSCDNLLRISQNEKSSALTKLQELHQMLKLVQNNVIQNFNDSISHNVDRIYETIHFILSGTLEQDPIELNIKYREYISTVNTKIHEIYTGMSDHKIQQEEDPLKQLKQIKKQLRLSGTLQIFKIAEIPDSELFGDKEAMKLKSTDNSMARLSTKLDFSPRPKSFKKSCNKLNIDFGCENTPTRPEKKFSLKHLFKICKKVKCNKCQITFHQECCKNKAYVPGSQDQKVPVCDFCFDEIQLVKNKKQHHIIQKNSVWKSDFVVSTEEKKQQERQLRRQKIMSYKITHIE